MKKLLLGAVMAAFVVTGAYGDVDIIKNAAQQQYSENTAEVLKNSLAKYSGFDDLKKAFKKLRTAIGKILSTDQNDSKEGSTQYSKDRVTPLKEAVNSVVDNIKALDIHANESSLKMLQTFKSCVQEAREKGYKLLTDNNNMEDISKDYNEESVKTLRNDIINQTKQCWNDIEKALEDKGVFTTEEQAIMDAAELQRKADQAAEAAKKAQEAAEAAKKAQEAAEAAKKAQEAAEAAKKAQEEAARAAAGKATKKATASLLKSRMKQYY